MEFYKTNMNPKGWKTGDCVIRAIAYATNKPWAEVYKDLCEVGLKKCRMPNDDIVWQKYLKDIGWEKMPQPRKVNGDKYTVEKFADHVKLFIGDKPAIVRVAHHLTVVEDGDLVDTWDCGYKTVGNWWVKE